MTIATPGESEADTSSLLRPTMAIAAAIRGEPPTWPKCVGARTIERIVEIADREGVLALLGESLCRYEGLRTAPPEVRVAFQAELRKAAACELTRLAELRRVLTRLEADKIECLLLKGAGLAYSLYRTPSLRQRADTDFLVRPEFQEAARQALQDIGYRRTIGPAGSCVGYQTEFRYDDGIGLSHYVDLHWRISNVQYFAWRFAFDELADAAIAVPAIGPRAVRLGNPHSLTLALVHRAANRAFGARGSGDRLIWLYDIHLLIEVMSDAEIAAFISIVQQKRISAIAVEGLLACDACFHSDRNLALVETLNASALNNLGVDFLSASPIEREWLEFRSLPSARLRLAYVAGRLFPDREYLQERFPDVRSPGLLRLYVRRLREVLARRFTRGQG